MKKIISLLIVVAMLASSSLALSSCGNDETSKKTSESKGSTTTSTVVTSSSASTTTTAKATTTTSAEATTTTAEATTTTTGEGELSFFEKRGFTEEFLSAKADALSAEGFLIEYETSDGTEASTTVIGKKGDSFYMSGEGTEILFCAKDEKSGTLYMKTEGEEKWIKEDLSSDDENIEVIRESIMFLLASYMMIDVGNIAEDGKETVAGATCSKFSGSDENGKYEAYIDDETGIGMKIVSEMTVEGETLSQTMECKKFEKSYTIEAPADSEVTAE